MISIPMSLFVLFPDSVEGLGWVTQVYEKCSSVVVWELACLVDPQEARSFAP